MTESVASDQTITSTSGHTYMINILVVEDNEWVRKGLCQIIQSEPDMQVAAEACNGSEALMWLEICPHPNIVLTDLNMPTMNGPELTRRITASYPHIAVIILTMHCEVAYQEQAHLDGAKGFLSKSADTGELIATIHAVHAGQHIFSDRSFI